MTETLISDQASRGTSKLQPLIRVESRLELRDTSPRSAELTATAGSVQDRLRMRLAQGTLSRGEVDDLIRGHAARMERYRKY